MNEQSMRFRVGVFILGALILLSVLITLFGSYPAFFKRHNHFTIEFKDASGVAAGTPVRRSGVRIGEVTTLTMDDEAETVVVHILVDRKYSLRESDQAILIRGLLGGDTSIDFMAPPPNGHPVERVVAPNGYRFEGVTPNDVRALLTQTSELMPGTQDALMQLRKTLKRLDQMSPDIEEAIREYKELGKASRQSLPDLMRTNDEIQVAAKNWAKLGERTDILLQTNQEKLVKTLENFNDTVLRVGILFNDENQKNFSAVIRNVKNGTENLDSLSKSTEEMIKESRQVMQRVHESVRQTDQVLANLQQTTKPMAERSDRVMRNLDESTDRLNRLLHELNSLVHTINSGNGTIKQFLTDPSLYNNVNEAACMLARMMPRLDRIMQDVEVFADKVARHPESLGLGGVVKPNSGLK